jgi:hypothetical protein
MEYIGKRISIKKKEEETSIVILSTADKQKKMLLLVWLLLWTISGIVVISQYPALKDQDTRAAVIVWMGFWAYFEFRMIKVFRWRSKGMEKIKLREGKLFYKRDIRGKGKIHVYQYDFIKELRLITSKDGFMESLNNSFWVIAGEKLAFDYYGKEIKFGIQLDDADAKELKRRIEKLMC